MNDLQAMLEQLRHPDAAIRRKALDKLTYVAEDISIPREILDYLIRDQDDRVRESTLEYLQWHTPANHTDYLITALADPKAEVRWKAVRHLCEFPDSRAAPFLRTLLNETDPDRRYFVITALGACDDGHNADILFELLRNPATTSNDIGVSLGKIAKPEMAEHIRQLVYSENVKVAEAAVWGIKEVGNAAVVPDLLQCMVKHYNNGQCVRSIIWAIQQLPNPLAINSLILASQDQRPYVATSAIVALGSYPEPRVVDFLLRYLTDKNDGIRASAVNALKHMPGVTKDLIKGLQAETNSRITGVFARVLAERGDKSAIPALKSKLKALRERLTQDELSKAIAHLQER